VWLDSHCHVTADAFAEDRDAVLERARQAGVGDLVAIGSGYGAARLGEAARRDYLSRFTPEIHIEQLTSMFRNVIHQPSEEG